MKVAFVTLNAYDMLTGGKGGEVGGAQLQQILIGQELVDRGHDVYFIEHDGPDKQAQTINGINIVLKPHHTTGSPPAKAIRRTIDTVRILRSLSPDACYVRVPLFEVFPVAGYCTFTDARFVYGFAHDRELTNDPVTFKTAYTDNVAYRRLMRFALGTADTLVAQNNFQFRAARRQFETDVVKIPNGYEEPSADRKADPVETERPVILWVSTLRPWKRPELVLEVADAVPDAQFVVVGGPDNEAPEVAVELNEAAADQPNLLYEGFVPYEDIGDYYTTADIFLNTSTDEGFPNTFLEAWSHETPVVSLAVDPSGVLTDNGIGLCANNSMDELVNAVSTLISDGETRARLGRRSLEYFRDNHGIERVADQYERVFADE